MIDRKTKHHLTTYIILWITVLLMLFAGALLVHAQNTSQSSSYIQYIDRAENEYRVFQFDYATWWDRIDSSYDSAWNIPAESTTPDERQQSYDDYTDQRAAEYDRMMQGRAEQYDAWTQAMAEMWDAYTLQQQAAYDNYVHSVQQQWGGFLGSTRTTWVEYDTTRDSRSFVDFDNGVAVFEVLVPEDTPNPQAVAEERLKQLVEYTLQKKTLDDQPLLEDQLPPPTFIEEQAHTPVERPPVQGGDGETRRRYTIATPLVADHLQRRAERFRPYVQRYCAEYSLDPALVMAIIQTESNFNPEARSAAHAYGLMQIIPRWAGLETMREIYNSDQIPSPAYLTDPENNIRHGCCYLHLLQSRYFRSMTQETKRDYVIICSYNWGPGNVRRRIVDQYSPIERYSDREVYTILRNQTPNETSRYLASVTDRRNQWSGGQ